MRHNLSSLAFKRKLAIGRRVGQLEETLVGRLIRKMRWYG